MGRGWSNGILFPFAQGSPGADGPPGRDGAAGVKVNIWGSLRQLGLVGLQVGVRVLSVWKDILSLPLLKHPSLSLRPLS